MIVKVAEFLPAGTVTVDGTCASGLLEDNDRMMPPVGAIPDRLTVPMLLAPPRTLFGDALTACRLAG